MALPRGGTRKSGRTRQPSKKYGESALDSPNVDGVVVGDDAVGGPSEEPNNEDNEDEEFIAPAEPDQDDDDDHASADDLSQPIDDDSNAEEQPPDDGGDDSFEDEDKFAARKRVVVRSRRAGPQKVKPTSVSHTGPAKPLSRGLLDHRKGSKEHNLIATFGPAPEDQNPAIQAQYRWGSEPTLPSRKADASGFGGFHRGYYRTEAMRKREMDNDWIWYDEDGGRVAFERRQTTTDLEALSAKDYLPRDRPPREVIMGPYRRQKMTKIALGRAINLNQPFTSTADLGAPQQDQTSIRHGWLLNLGDKVQCLDWAPNQDGKRQYLALATVPLEGHPTGHPPYKEPEAPAFTPQQPYKATIQIWEFTAGDENRISEQVPPKLRKVICTEWGDVKSIKWCPVPRKEPVPTIPSVSLSLGLLAGIWGDGAVRVLDISVQSSDDIPTQYEHCTTAALTCHPPHTLCTTVTWLSATGIAAGCANGCVGIWHLPTALHDPTPNALSTLFSPIQTGYILSLTSCYPSRPQILLASSTSGHITMTDLSLVTPTTGFDPSTTIPGPRSRFGKPVLAWHDFGQMVLMTDDNYTLQGAALRRFHRQIRLTRYGAACVVLATSPVHPFVMAGTLAGETVGTNPLRRVFNNKSEIWNQVWFAHEWRRAKVPDIRIAHLLQQPVNQQTSQADGGAVDTADDDRDEDTKMLDASQQDNHENNDRNLDPTTSEDDAGPVRISESFKAEQVRLVNDDDAFKNRVGGVAFTTVHERPTAVSALGWNPNVHVGGWCAAGMASGLLRVEDVARDR